MGEYYVPLMGALIMSVPILLATALFLSSQEHKIKSYRLVQKGKDLNIEFNTRCLPFVWKALGWNWYNGKPEKFKAVIDNLRREHLIDRWGSTDNIYTFKEEHMEEALGTVKLLSSMTGDKISNKKKVITEDHLFNKRIQEEVDKKVEIMMKELES